MGKYLDKQGLKDYISSLNESEGRKEYLCQVVDGAYLKRERKGEGTRSVHFLGGRQRVDTYNGRLKAVEKILKKKNPNLDSLGNFIYNSKTDFLNKEKSLIDSCEEDSNLATRNFGLENSSCQENLVSEYSPKKGKGTFKKVVHSTLGAALLGGAIFLGNDLYQSYTQYFYPSYTQGPSKELPSVEEISEKQIVLGENNSMQKVEYPINLCSIKKAFLAKELRESYFCLKNNVPQNSRVEITPSSLSVSKAANTQPLNVFIPSFGITLNLNNLENTYKKKSEVCLVTKAEEDLGLYLDHSNLRNSQIIEVDGKNDISISPLNYGLGIVDSFTPVLKDVSSYNDLGYSKKDFNKRGEKALSGLKKAGNGLAKILSLGFLDFNSENEKKNEGNQVLRVLKSPYDIAFGTIESTANTIDFATGGVTNKSLEVLTDFSSGVVESGAGTINYVGSFVGKGSRELEDLAFSNEGKVSQKAYELVSLIPRFGANVINHEVAKEGKITQVHINGEKVNLNKGEIGATLELSSSLALDTLGIIGMTGVSGKGSSSVSTKGSPSGGIIGGPGVGGPVGGGL